jgi:hypothetical protein
LKTKLKFIFQLFVLSALMFGCSDEYEQVVPSVSVRINVNLDLPRFSSLNFSGNAIIYPNAGYNSNGVIIYCLGDVLYAYDATCPQHIDTKTAVTLDAGDSGSDGQATCPSCDAIYYLSNYGYSSDGSHLQSYTVDVTGSRTFYVHN